jgi:hypothetical protein
MRCRYCSRDSSYAFPVHAGPRGSAAAMSPYQLCAGRIGTALQRMGFDRNPMRRGSDRIQSVLRAVVLTAFVLGGPAVTACACHVAYVAGLRSGQAQAAALHRVPAVVLHVILIATAWRHPPAMGGPALLSVQWTAPSQSSRTGLIRYGGHADVGSVVMISVDASGRLARAPHSHASAADRAIGAAAVTPMILALGLCAVYLAGSRILDRRRLAGWEAEWLSVEPRWTKRRLT